MGKIDVQFLEAAEPDPFIQAQVDPGVILRRIFFSELFFQLAAEKVRVNVGALVAFPASFRIRVDLDPALQQMLIDPVKKVRILRRIRNILTDIAEVNLFFLYRASSARLPFDRRYTPSFSACPLRLPPLRIPCDPQVRCKHKRADACR